MKRLSVCLTILLIFNHSYSKSDHNSLNFRYPVNKKNFINWDEPNSSSDYFLKGRIDFSLYYLPNLTVGGVSKNLGSEFRYFDNISWVDEDQLPDNLFQDARRDYGDKITPIITNPATKIPFKLDLGYTFNDIRIGLSWFHMSASDKQSGKVPGLLFSEEETEENFGYGFVSFWNMGLDLHASRNFPASWIEGYRDLDENENGDFDITTDPEKGATTWSSGHETSVNSFQLSFKRPVIKDENMTISLMGGLSFNLWKESLYQLMDITAYRSFKEKSTENIWSESSEDSIKIEIHYSSTFRNDITLETNSSVKFNPLGALIGLEAKWNILPALSFQISAIGSALKGDASYTGVGIDIDDIDERFIISVFDEGGNMIFTDFITGKEYLSGIFDLPENSVALTTTNYQLDISARYNIFNNISLTAGYYYSRWKNLPVSPQWTYPDTFTKPYGAFAMEESWISDIKTDISISSFKLGIALVF